MNRFKLRKQIKHKKIIFVAMTVVLLLSIAAGIILRPRGTADEDVIWREYQVGRGDIIASLDGGGKLEASGVQHSFDIDMKIEQVLVEVGDKVKKGDKLVEYSKEELEKKIEELKRALETAERALEDARNSRQAGQLQSSLTKAQNQQTSKNTYETQKRELENTIGESERKIQQLRGNLDALQQVLKNAEAGREDIQGLQEELKRLQEELAKLEAGVQTVEDESASPKTNLNETDHAETKTQSEDTPALIQKKKKQIEDIQSRIEAASEKENQIASLKEQISQAQTELDDANYQLETQKKALSQLNTDYERQVAQDKKNQSTQDQIDALNKAGQDNAVENAQAEVEKCRLELQEAEDLLSTPSLTAKTDGIITEVNCTQGETATGGKSIVTIGDTGQKQVIVQVPQEDIVSVDVGQQVALRFLANSEEAITGTVADKSLLPDDGGEGVNYKVTISLDEDYPELLQGMTCGVKFILKKVENVLTLSNKAIILRDGKQVVTVKLPDGSHEEREITTGFSDGRVSEIISGLTEGDIVLVEG